jgi:hypothetical protein
MDGDDFSQGGDPFTFNPARNSLFVGNRRGKIAEVTIPDLNRSADINTLWFAKYLQGFRDPTEGNVWQWAPTDAGIESILVHNNKLFGSGSIYYDANNIQRVSHYARSLDLSSTSFQGMVPVWQPDRMGFVSGFMANVPPEWQTRLGGSAITGQCCTPIAWKTSWGPSAFAFNPADIGVRSPVPATPLLYYPSEHPTLGHWNGTGATYGATTLMSGVAIINGTRTALYFGSNGTGAHCYGNGTSNQSLHLTTSPDGSIWCYDPTNTDKGSHAYPYRYQLWAYDLNDLAAVKMGTKQPWDVIPYGVWPFELPVPEIHARLGGVGYDPQRQLLYVSQLYADKDGYANRSLIHVLKVNNAPATLPMPTPSGPPPSGSGTVSSVSISPNKPAPQPPGSTITWTATASGGVSPLEFQWWVHNGVSWVTSEWSTSNVFSWTPTAAAETGRVAVRVRSYASLVTYEATTEWYYPISGTAVAAPAPAPPNPSPSSRTTAVALTANFASPQPPNTVITWTAVPTGGVAPHQYQWWVYDGTWTAATGWTASNTHTWRPTVANANYRVAVWVRSAGATSGYETSRETSFSIAGVAVAPAPAPAPAPSTARVTAVGLGASATAPQPAYTQIIWTATPTGGTAPHQYQWWVHNGASWAAATAWTAANTYTWVPTAAQANYRVAVWVRSAGSSGESEASAEKWFSITAGVAPPPPVASAPTARVSSVGLTPNLASPQPLGTSIVWSATPLGGVAPHQYQWWIFNGSTWLAATSWTTASTYTWQPGAAGVNYRMAVWVRSAGSTGGSEASTERWFTVAPGTAPAPPPPAPVVASSASAVTIAANLSAPQLTNTAITWTATVTGGVAPYQYQWWTYDGTNWTSYAWTSSSTFLWQPTIASASARVAVYVRSAWNTGSREASGEAFFPIR